MNIEDHPVSVVQFAHCVADAFDLVEVISILPMAGSANRLWQLTTTKGKFVVKELPYYDGKQDENLRRAVTFEAMLIGEQRVPGPAPVPNRSGDYISILPDSRGKESPVRLHRWFTGAPPRVDDPATLMQAGRTLRTIQLAGASWSVRPTGVLGVWNPDPRVVLEQFLASGYSEGAAGSALYSTVADALNLIRAGEAMPGDWVYTHRDHKPENCLSQDSVLAVLDWDECNYCHPRLEAVESALRWAGNDDPNPSNFCAFMRGYNEAGVPLDSLYEQDFAKLVAALLEWFCFQARLAVGEWAEVTATERTAAADLACDALSTLQSSLSAIPRWTRLLDGLPS